MQISADFSILSESALFDSEKKSLSIINVIDAVEVDKLPAVIDSLRLVSRFSIEDSEDGEIPISFKLFRPNGEATEIKSPGVKEYTITVVPNQSNKQRAGIIVNISIDVHSEGEYSIKTFYNDEEITSQYIDVSVSK